MHTFSISWKHQKILRFSNVFREYRKVVLGTNRLRKFVIILQLLKDIIRANKKDPKTTDSSHECLHDISSSRIFWKTYRKISGVRSGVINTLFKMELFAKKVKGF